MKIGEKISDNVRRLLTGSVDEGDIYNVSQRYKRISSSYLLAIRKQARPITKNNLPAINDLLKIAFKNKERERLSLMAENREIKKILKQIDSVDQSENTQTETA